MNHVSVNMKAERNVAANHYCPLHIGYFLYHSCAIHLKLFVCMINILLAFCCQLIVPPLIPRLNLCKRSVKIVIVVKLVMQLRIY